MIRWEPPIRDVDEFIVDRDRHRDEGIFIKKSLFVGDLSDVHQVNRPLQDSTVVLVRDEQVASPVLPMHCGYEDRILPIPALPRYL